MTKLQAKRMERNMSRSELAKKSGVSMRCIEGYEQELRTLFKASFVTCMKLADALECSVMDIVDIPKNGKTKINQKSTSPSVIRRN